MFSASIANVAALSCGSKAAGASCGGKSQTWWWTIEVKEAVKLKEFYQAMLAQNWDGGRNIEELIDPIVTSSTEEVEAGESKEDSAIPQAKVTEVS